MTNKTLKDFRNAIHKNLKVEPQNKKSSCFIIKEDKKESLIKQIHFTFKNQDDILIIKQDKTENLNKNYTIENLFEKNSPNTNCCCDFILFLKSKNNELEIYCCEIKSRYCEKYLNEALHQTKSSKLFVSYLLEYYSYLYNTKLEPTNFYRFYIYPQINIANKLSAYKKGDKVIYSKPIKIDGSGCAKITNGYDFFNF
ncbi:hypothetical protein [Helicobacter sp. T3_23-1056]